VVGTQEIGILVAKACGMKPYEGEIARVAQKGGST